MRAAATRPAPRDPSPRTLGDLRRALDEKERELRELLARQESLAREVGELGEMLEAMLAGSGAALGRGERPAGRAPRTRGAAAEKPRETRPARAGRERAPRAAREGSLPVVIRSVLERVVGPMRVAEIADAVVKSGYATKSKNLNIIVANRLAKMPDVEKVERGLYQLRRSTTPSNGDAPDAAATG